MKITAEYLDVMGACLPEVEQFRYLFGESVELTVELAAQYADKFDWVWAAEVLLTETAEAEYDQHERNIRIEYATAMRTAQIMFDETVADARNEFAGGSTGDRFNDTYLVAREKYREVRNIAQAEYDKADQAADSARNKATAIAWAEMALKYGLKKAP